MSTEPVFPAIAISPGDAFEVVDRVFDQGTRRAITSGYFTRLYFFDSEGRRFPVEDVEAAPSLRDRALDRSVPIRLRLGAPVAVELADVVSDLVELIDADPDDLYDQFISHDELKVLLKGAKSAVELIRHAATLGEPG